MVPHLENMQRPRVIEINIRIDCNGCVQKLKKALNGIQGIYDFHIDIPRQKLIITGWADPERIIKAIKKVRKIATIWSPQEAPDPNCQPTPYPDCQEPQNSGNAPPFEPQNSETSGPPPEEPPTQPPENPPENHRPPEAQPSQPGYEHQYNEENQVINHHPPNQDYGCGYSDRHGPQHSHPGSSYHDPPTYPDYQQQPRPIYDEPAYHEPPPKQPYHEPQPPPQSVYATHNYNRYSPFPNITGYQSVHSLPPYRTYDRADNYCVESYQNGSSSNGNLSSMFSDENPNACTIV